MLRKLLKWRNSLWVHLVVIILFFLLIRIFDKYIRVDLALLLFLLAYLFLVLISFFTNLRKYLRRKAGSHRLNEEEI